MAQQTGPSYTDLVYEVLKSAGRPLTFQEIFDEVNRRRPVTTRNPKGTIRYVLTQGRQLVSTGDRRYGYLPHLLSGSALRVPLTEKKPANHPLIYTDEVLHALWPGFLETPKRATKGPIRARLPNGEEVILTLDLFAPGVWGSPTPEALRRYLADSHAAEGDGLLIRVVDAEAGQYEAWFESRRRREAAKAEVAKRNQELADAAYEVLRKSPSREKPIWDLVVALLARGLYRSEIAPDPLEAVLKADRRFVYAGISMWTLAETMTPEMRALVRDRQKLEGELSQAAEAAGVGQQKAPAVLDFRRAMERTMADLGAALSEREFGSIEEANAFLQEMAAGGGLGQRRAETPLEKAQDLMYEAWEAPSSRERIRLAKKALETSPDCADAYVLLAEETARGPAEAADLYAKGVAAGERALGKEAFREDVGHFWGIIETRPYMRARLGQAQALWAMGKQQEAIGHVWEMLRLNPDDNQGVRYMLLNWLLETGDDAQVKKLFKRYPDDAAAVWLYGRALHAFRTEGDTSRARKLQAEAEQGNSFVPDYLLGRKPLPRQLPQLIGLGDESEAIYCVAEQAVAWLKAPGALEWLAGRG